MSSIEHSAIAIETTQKKVPKGTGTSIEPEGKL